MQTINARRQNQARTIGTPTTRLRHQRAREATVEQGTRTVCSTMPQDDVLVRMALWSLQDRQSSMAALVARSVMIAILSVLQVQRKSPGLPRAPQLATAEVRYWSCWAGICRYGPLQSSYRCRQPGTFKPSVIRLQLIPARLGRKPQTMAEKVEAMHKRMGFDCHLQGHSMQTCPRRVAEAGTLRHALVATMPVPIM